MITSEYYATKLEELKNLNYIERDIIPSSEPVFNVFLNTRKIEVPSSFRQIAMRGDHKAETVWFTLDRYFDGQDLADPSKKWAVQFINAKNEELLVPITYKYVDSQNLGTNDNPVKPNETLNKETTLKLGWEITYDLTKEFGKVQFSLRCFTVENDKISYNLGTEMVTTTIGNTLMISDTENPNIMNPPKDNLTHLVDRIEDLYKNNSLSKFNYNDLNEETLPAIDGIILKGQYLTSADFKNISYEQLKDKPIYRINGEELVAGGDLELLAEADAVLSETSTNPIQNKAVAAAIKEIREELEEMTFIPLGIVSFDNSLKLYEKNSTYNGPITFSWEISGNAKTLALYDSHGVKLKDLPVGSAKGFMEVEITGLKDTMEYRLLAIDPKNNENEEFTSVIFTYRVFWGAVPAQETYTSDFISSLEGNSLQQTKETTFSINAGEQDYVFFCAPKSYGVKPDSFVYGVTAGGFGSAPVATVTYNKTEYEIWKSDYSGFGESTFKVV